MPRQIARIIDGSTGQPLATEEDLSQACYRLIQMAPLPPSLSPTQLLSSSYTGQSSGLQTRLDKSNQFSDKSSSETAPAPSAHLPADFV